MWRFLAGLSTSSTGFRCTESTTNQRYGFQGRAKNKLEYCVCVCVGGGGGGGGDCRFSVPGMGKSGES